MTRRVLWTPAMTAGAQADMDAGHEDADIARNYGLTIRQVYNAVANGNLTREKKKTGPKRKWAAPQCPQYQPNWPET